MIRKCATCGRYFIPESHKNFYCTRLNEEIGKRCCEERPKARHVNKLKKLGIYEEYNRVNNLMRYHSKQYHWSEKKDEINVKYERISRIKENLMKHINIEKARETDDYKQFFEIINEMKNILKNKR